MNQVWTTLARVVLYSTILLFVSLPNSSLLAQNDNPCDCTLRWEDGSDWVDNGDGTFSINDNASGTGGGIVRCGNSAEVHSNIQSNCTYDNTAFDLSLYTDMMSCIEKLWFSSRYIPIIDRDTRTDTFLLIVILSTPTKSEGVRVS